VCASALVTRKFCKFGYLCPLWVRAVVESASIWPKTVPMGHANSEFALECPTISSLTTSLAFSGNPPAVWYICVVDGVSLCRSLAHGFGLCGALMLVLGTP
jgi:hypothetical protein